MAGFLDKLWGKITYPFREDGLGDDIANSSAFPFKDAQDLMAKPSQDLSNVEKSSLNKLMKQTERSNQGVTGMASTVVGRGADTVIDAAKDKAMAVIKPYMVPFEWLMKNWKMVAAGIVAVGGFLSGSGVVGGAVAVGAGVYIGNEVLVNKTGRGIIDRAKELFGYSKHKDESPSKGHNVSVSRSSSSSLSQSASPNISKPSTGLASDKDWASKVSSGKTSSSPSKPKQTVDNWVDRSTAVAIGKGPEH